MSKKQKREYYMAVIKSNLGWRFKDFKGMTFEEIEAKFAQVWKRVEDFIPMGSKEEAERLKRKGINLEKEQVKKQKSSEEAPETETSTKEFTEDKIKEIMQLVPVEDVYYIPTAPIPPVTQPDTTPIRQYTRRARIAQSFALLAVVDEPAFLVRYAQDEEIVKLKDRVKVLEDKEDVTATQSGDDAPIKGRTTVLARRIDVPTGSGSIPTAGPPATIISTGSKVVPTASPIVTRRKGKEVMVESDTPKKKKLQEQIDTQSIEKANDQEAEEGILYGCDQKQLGVEVQRFQ
nr:hypothetical protein [Tanacetum cinerariifolium]